MKLSNDHQHLNDLALNDPTAHYNRVTRAWGFLLGENLHYGYFGPDGDTLTSATESLSNKMTELAQLQAGHRVLDVGCGTGNPACMMAQDYAASVIGISPSKICVEQARDRALSRTLTGQVEFIMGDGALMCFTEQSFDCVWIMESSHLIPDKQSLIKEACRVLKPGGRLVLCDIILHQTLALETVIQYRDEFLLLRDAFGRARMATMEFYNDQFACNKMSVLHSENISFQTQPTFSCWRENAYIHKDKVIKLIGEEGWNQFVESCDVLEKFWAEQILGYGIIAAIKPD
ncbi:cyclopropane-fatty-acyl-phospholipid synthase family protein [Oceanicoccus sp. KOV_DT_Chl]|uniref:SAM-dependent methyltransferase n=1 Tax=Oceanicoccus sp. KOV_DT_Chl TaxID=1904639 RepID=UPI0013568C2E|nr:methyltransferase domain-containing protein [Oceanicoccus sp. KOV_DT_Chl]